MKANNVNTLQQAWAHLHQTIEAARLKIESTERFRNSESNRVAIYRSLAQVQAMAYNFAVAPSVTHPRILVNTTYQTNIYSLGLACQDFFYGATFLDGRNTYRISGRSGAIRWLSAQVQTKLIGGPEVRNIGDFKLAEFATSADGRFEVILSATSVEGPHIPLDAGSPYHFVWIRRILGDWNDDHGELRIELIEQGQDVEDDEAALIFRLDVAANFAKYLLENWAIGLYDYFFKLGGGFNAPANLGPMSAKDAGSPEAYYASFVYQLAPDEALVIEGKIPDAPYWGVQLGDVWSNSLDFMNHQADLNMTRTVVDADGCYRAVVAANDPGVANWLDTQGHTEGIAMMRTFDCAEQPPLPTFRVVKLESLKAALPTDTRYVDAATRARNIAYRRESLTKLYGE